MKFLKVLIIALFFIYQIQGSSIVLNQCDTLLPIIFKPLIRLRVSTLADGTTVVDTMDHLNTCLNQISQYQDNSKHTQLTIDLNGTDLSGEITSIDLSSNNMAAFDTTFTLIILDTNTSSALLFTDQAYTLFLNNIETNKNILTNKEFSFTVIAANAPDKADATQIATARSIVDTAGTVVQFTIDGDCQNVYSTQTLLTCIAVTDKTACNGDSIVIDLSAATITESELATCLTAANVSGGLLTQINVDVSSQSLTAFPDLATSLSSIKTQITDISINASGNTITTLPDLSGFTALSNASIDISDNGLDKDEVKTLLQTIENASFANDLTLTITLLANGASNQNQLTDYDVLIPSLTSQATIQLAYSLLKDDGSTSCTADNGPSGTKNTFWSTSTNTACDDITKSLELTIDNTTPQVCTGSTVTITLNNDWINGEFFPNVSSTASYSYQVTNSGTAVDSSTMESLDTTTFVNTLKVEGLTVGETYTVTSSVTISSQTYTSTATFVPATCVPNGNIAVTDTDSDSTNQICEVLTLSVPTLNNDSNNLDQTTLTWTWTINPAPSTAPVATNQSSLVLAANTLTAGTEYTVTASISETTMVISNGSDFKFTPVACNTESEEDDDDNNDDDEDGEDNGDDGEDYEDDGESNDNNDENSQILRYSTFLLVVLTYII